MIPAIRHVTYIAVAPERVYEALTTGAGWDAWFTNGTTVEAGPGGQISPTAGFRNHAHLRKAIAR